MRELYCPCRGRQAHMYRVRKQRIRAGSDQDAKGMLVGNGMEENKTEEALWRVWVDSKDNTTGRKRDQEWMVTEQGKGTRSCLLELPCPSGICWAHMLNQLLNKQTLHGC